MRVILPQGSRGRRHTTESAPAEQEQKRSWFSGRYLAEVWAKPPAKLISFFAFFMIAGLLLFVFASGSETTTLQLSSGRTNNTTVNSNGGVTLSQDTNPPPSFIQVFADEFGGTALSSSWVKYNGLEGPCCPDNLWRDYNLSVSSGYLHMISKKDPAGQIGWTSAGTSMGKSLNQTHGQWDVRLRADKAKGVGFAMLLWPQTGGNPPELDFDEEGPSDGTTRSLLTANTHYGGGIIHHKENLDLTQWHTISVRWIPGEVDYMVDGVTWAKDTSPLSAIPTVPMHLALQAEVGKKGSDSTRPDSTTPNPNEIQIDWVHIYSYK